MKGVLVVLTKQDNNKVPVSLTGRAARLNDSVSLGVYSHTQNTISLGSLCLEGIELSKAWHKYQFESDTGTF